MHRRNIYFLLATAGLLILIVCGIALAMPQPAKAQCGSQASSCKNCHEVQGKDPVNADGTGWHQSHAFGDFCYICHGGNNQATDETAAHAAMVAPLSDVQAACQQCHPNDLQARADVYAKTLGVQVGAGAAAPSAAAGATAATHTAAAPAAQVAEPPAPASSGGDLVDYVQRYNENALGQRPTSTGNVILTIVLVGLVLAGLGFVARREGWVRVSFRETTPIDKEYPQDVVDMAADIARLKPTARRSLKNLLGKPQAASELLSAIDKLSPSVSDEKK
jgi:hypothetical protein